VNFRKLRLVSLESFYDCADDPLAQKLLPRFMALKIRGYLKEYAYGALPVDTTDLIGSHFAVCEERQGELFPLTAFKSMSSVKCKTHNVHFPLITLLGSMDMPDHRKAIEGVLASAAARNRPVMYGSSWTKEPAVRDGDRELSRYLRDLFVAMNIFHIRETGAELMTLGVPRFKTDALFMRTWGCVPIRQGGQDLPPIKHAFLGGEPTLLLHSPGIPDSAMVYAEPFEALWRNRIAIRAADPAAATRKAA
jgi:hypothetical protein